MGKTTIIIICVFVILFIFVSIILIQIKHRKKKNILDAVDKLTLDKNLIISTSLVTELSKAEKLVNNKKLQSEIDEWNNRYKSLEREDMQLLTDKIVDIENLIYSKDYDKASDLISSTEKDIFHVKAKAHKLLNDIKTLTESEERNREAITKLKSVYREVVFKYNKNKNDYNEVSVPIELQFENIDKLFSGFEVAINNSEYDEISKIVKVLDDMIKNMEIVIEEAPTILLMANVIIPKKMKDIKNVSEKMIRDGYNLEYLNIEYNINETEKKVSEIVDRLKVLNVQDSVFDLKTLLDYYESIYNDFENEKRSKRDYERSLININDRLVKVSSIIRNLYNEIDILKETYDLKDDDMKTIDDINKELIETKDSFKLINDRTLIKISPYSKLSEECGLISVRLTKLEENLESTLINLGSLKEDEKRARDQLFEIKTILKDARYKIKEYNLPTIPKKFYIELKEAYDGIKEINKELEKKPISIKTLNLRVDTARDLSLKLYATASSTIKEAKMAEAAIVYGNRYRSEYREIETGLISGTKAFNKGDYKTSLEIVLNSLDVVEPGVYKKIASKYE